VPIVLGGGGAVDTPGGAVAISVGRKMGRVPHGVRLIYILYAYIYI